MREAAMTNADRLAAIRARLDPVIAPDGEVAITLIDNDEVRWLLDRLLEPLRLALQEAQGVALNGTDGADTDAERLDRIDQIITEALALLGGQP